MFIFSKQNENLRSTWSTRVLQLRDRLAEETDSKSPTVELEICYPRPVEERVEWQLVKVLQLQTISLFTLKVLLHFWKWKSFFSPYFAPMQPLSCFSLYPYVVNLQGSSLLSLPLALFPLSPTPDSIILITFEGREHQVFTINLSVNPPTLPKNCCI